MQGMIVSAWRYRHFIASSVRAEFANRFARSRLGGAWMVLNPLAQSAVIAFVLSGVLASRLPGVNHAAGYALYLMAGSLCWALFSDTVLRCLSLYTDNGNLLKKLVFPRICLPLVVAGIAGVGNGLLAAATGALFLAMGHGLGWPALALPLLMGLTLALALGLGLALGVLNVFVRDVSQVVPILMQFLFWFTPVVYLPSLVPEAFRPWLALNPMQVLVVAYQQVLVFGQWPAPGPLAAVAALAVVLLAFSLWFFRRAQADMVDAL